MAQQEVLNAFFQSLQPSEMTKNALPTMSLLIINPNSTASITLGLVHTLIPTTTVITKSIDGLDTALTPNHVQLTFYTAPENAPPSINDVASATLSGAIVYQDLKSRGWLDSSSEIFDGFLVCCFSNHPLTHILREELPPNKPCIGIMDAAVTHSLLIGKRFGLLSTGSGYNPDRWSDVSAFLGGQSERFAGLVSSGLGVVELRSEDSEGRKKVEERMKKGGENVARLGADVIVLACAGMAGMEGLVKQGVAAAGLGTVRVVDGNKAGVEILSSLVRLSR